MVVVWSLKATGPSLFLYGKEQLEHYAKYLLLCSIEKEKSSKMVLLIMTELYFFV